MSLDKAVGSWFRQSFAWSNERDAWRERLIGILFLLIAVGFAILSFQLDLWKAAVLWAAYFLALAICSRQGWLKLLGPVLFYDMIRTSRRSRYAIMRLLYAALLLFVLCSMFMSMDFANRGERGRDSAIMAQQFFGVFMLVQLTIVVLLTPAYVAGAISEEKDRKTLEFMLATDLHNREIILSKLLSRVANITLLLITGLPILSILQFVGGVDAQLMIAGFAGTGLTMLGIASLSILMSTLFQKPRDSIGVTYLLIVTYVFGMMAFLVMKEAFPAFMKESLWEGTPTLADMAEVANAGNPLMAIIDIIMAIEGRSRVAPGTPTSLVAALPGILERYAIFHVGLAVLCVTWSIIRLRTIALKQTVGGSTKKLRWWERYRPPIGEMPMMWKELHIEGRTKFNWLIFGAVVILILLTLGSGLLVICNVLWEHFLGGRSQWRDLQEGMNVWFRVAGTGVGCLMLLMMAVRAATSVTNERERDTFDALITTPMSSEAMLSAKLLGTLMSLRMGWLWYGSMMALAILSGGIHLLAVPLVLTAWFIYAVFFSMVGMWFSMACKSSMRATVLTVLTVLFLGGGHWIFAAMCFYFPVSLLMRGGPGDFMEYIVQFEAGLTPPWVLGLSAYSWDDLAVRFNRNDKMGEMLVFCLIGLFLWALACVIMWYGVLIPKFRQLTRREELVYQ
jgi:ABC-type transport system involved in multi-copper enzyme maturation permease subunit